MARVERDKRPVRGVGSSEALGSARRQRHIETIQRHLQALAAGLYVGFLASPAGVETFVALFGRESVELCEFVLGKEAAGDVFPVFDGADEFDVDAEAAVGGEGEKGKAARVGDVEMDGRIAGGGTGLGEAGFAAVGVVELDVFGRRGEVLAEEIAEGGTGSDVGVAVAVEGEAFGAGMLVGGEAGLPSDGRQALGIVGEAPDVDFTLSHARDRVGRRRPGEWGGRRHGGILCQIGVARLREKHFPNAATGHGFCTVADS